MKNQLLQVGILAAFLVSGCATYPTGQNETFQPTDLNPLLASGMYQQKVDHFYVINDSSDSMSETYEGPGFGSGSDANKFGIEKELLSRLNQTLPDIKLTSGIRSFGFGPCTAWGPTQLNMAPAEYSKSSFSAGIDALTCSGGGSPMASAVEAAATDLSSSSGQIAVLVLSDGYELDGNPIPSVEALKQQYGDRVCVYSIWVGNENEEGGKVLLNALSDRAKCGYRAQVADVASSAGMAQFVQNVFLKPAAVAAADCSAMDSDADGVNDCDDKCPNSLSGIKVGKFGCWIVDVKFDNDKDIIKPQYYPNLDSVADAIAKHPEVMIEVQGHTSKTGGYEHNMDLSDRRAKAVMNYLKRGHNFPNVISRGYGWNQPIDTNDTEEGRANNRRVQLEVNGVPQAGKQ